VLETTVHERERDHDPVEALTLDDWAVLGGLTEREQHGFAIARELGTDGALGHTWTVPRSLVDPRRSAPRPTGWPRRRVAPRARIA
jgi:hypothetical protein